MTTSNKIEELKYMLTFDFCFFVDRIGRGGDLACLWNKNLNCPITNFSQNHIDVDVNDSLRGRWRLTGFMVCRKEEDRESFGIYFDIYPIFLNFLGVFLEILRIY